MELFIKFGVRPRKQPPEIVALATFPAGEFEQFPDTVRGELIFPCSGQHETAMPSPARSSLAGPKSLVGTETIFPAS